MAKAVEFDGKLRTDQGAENQRARDRAHMRAMTRLRQQYPGVFQRFYNEELIRENVVQLPKGRRPNQVGGQLDE